MLFSRFANAAAPTFGQLAQSPTSSGFGDGQSSAGFGAPQAPSSPFGGTPSSAGFGGFGQTPSSPGFGGAQPQGEDMGYVRVHFLCNLIVIECQRHRCSLLHILFV